MSDKSRWRTRKVLLEEKCKQEMVATAGRWRWHTALRTETNCCPWGERPRGLRCWGELAYLPRHRLWLLHIQRLLWEKRECREEFVWKNNENGFPVERTIKIIYSNFPFFKANDSCMKIPYWMFSYRKIYSRL